MRVDRLTTKSREAVQEAQSLAAKKGNPELLPEHVVLALLAQRDGVTTPMLQKAGADLEGLQRALEAHVAQLPRVQGGSEPGLSRRTLSMLNHAEEEAKALGDSYVSVEHMLLALLRHDKDAASIFERARVRPDALQ